MRAYVINIMVVLMLLASAQNTQTAKNLLQQ